jgi:bifunctional oligoribonuclease and PAP phosphatase NrnA
VNASAAAVADVLRARHSFVLTSHARPDGDAIGSCLALALALDLLGKRARVILRDPVPTPYRTMPAVNRVEVADRLSGTADAVVVMECSDLDRPDVAGLEEHFIVNVDHHLGNAMYGAVNWFDGSAAACGEMVADIIDALQVPWTADIASQLFLAVATDTGGFRYGPMTARTFDLCRRVAVAGVSPASLARQIFDSYSVGRVRLTGALLNAMELHHDSRLAVLTLDDDLLQACGATSEDTEGLVNLPLGAREVVAVALLKRQNGDTFRISLRSKGAVDVRAVAETWDGGGHQNAAGCTIIGPMTDVRDAIVTRMKQVIDAET